MLLNGRVFDLSISAWQQHVDNLPSIPHAWVRSVKRQGSEMAIADTQADPLSATQLLAACIAFSKRIKSISHEQNVGILLPTSTGGVIANMATLLAGKTVVNLNYTASNMAIKSAIEQSDIATVYTSRLFLSRLSKKNIDPSDALVNSNVVYMEDIKEGINKAELLRHWLTVKFLPSFLLRLLFCRVTKPTQTAAILFSSGSEGAPKGIMLSHRNIMANLKQISDVLNTQDEDVVMASLPLFHAFGLTVTQFMPLIEGLPMVCQPDPTDAFTTAKAVAKYRATIMFGTSTFLRLYTKNRKVHPLMFESLRIVVAGAEKLNEQVRTDFLLKFNKIILEGYGATETTPVASVNLPDSLDLDYWQIQAGGKRGTVGMPLPGTSFKIIDPDTEQELATGEDGMIIIGGTQVMQGYLKNPEKTAEVIREIEGQRWYITGDKGRVDKDGFLTIVDRYSRFAKIGGEMIGLAEIEEKIKTIITDHNIAVDEEFELLATTISDDKKGETIVLLVTSAIELSIVKPAMIAAACTPLSIPSRCVLVDSIPKLGSGKTDFSKAKSLAIEAANNA